MISQQRRDVKYFLKISYKKAQKNPLLLGTMRVLKSLSRPFVSLAVLRHHRSVCGLKGRAFSYLKNYYLIKLLLCQLLFPGWVEKELQGAPGRPARGHLEFAPFCPRLPKFFQVCPN